MDVLHVSGNAKLKGVVKAQGAKNAMTKLLVASLLSNKRCLFHNVPNIGDVEITVNLCKEIGSEVTWDRKQGTLEIITRDLKTSYIPQRFSGANRIPILMIGALLGRTSEDIIIPTVGGDAIGNRTVDFHIAALTKLGATIEYREMKKEGAYLAHAHNGLKGNIIKLPYPSIGATENSILAGVRASGHTVICNAAIEPEIVDLILFLQKLGANISIESDRSIHIEGTQTCYEVEHTVLTDRIEAASFAMVALATHGKVFVEGAQHQYMISFLNKIRELGGGFAVKQNGIEFFSQGPLRGGQLIETDVHPGFMTDWQQPYAVLLTQAEGASVIHETVYDNRFGYTAMLKKMGADIELFHKCLGNKPCRFALQNYQHSIIVKGKTPLQGCEISIPDLRAGFAYVMAGLVAKGQTIIHGMPFLDRGYANLVEKLQGLGADVKRLKTLPDTTPVTPILPPVSSPKKKEKVPV
ncbi:MAG: UDP-N-acetylglucosamine 1-carboxyvinyltransferase [Verrucomicrobia bacterium]|nr:UDP-N-acetylglucosamine 1-carboxyvinyltransferase [Verrucomicrobiota bacterium]MBS0646558.1 UDP-N-acetylglucosamine 1-carboxyvinyltransferase [Verrucomicrobiota bacterium]